MTQYFSIVIPTYNRARPLSDCLSAIVKLEFSRDRFEVIVVDDGSDHSTADVIRPFEVELNVKLLTQSNAGPATARNYGANQANGEIIVFIDDDCRPAPDWLKKILECFNTKKIHAVGGKIINSLVNNLYSSASQLHVDYLYSYYNINPDKPYFISTSNFAVLRETFNAIGGFNESFITGEDREFCDRLVGRGYSMYYKSEIVVYHAHKLDLRTFCLQHYNYGKGAFAFRRFVAARRKRPIRIEYLSFYFRLVSYPFSQKVNLRSISIVNLMFVSQFVNTLGFFTKWVVRSVPKTKKNLVLSKERFPDSFTRTG